jgi:hypothetical protein
MLAPSAWIYTNKILLVDYERPDLFAICLSSFFRNWLYAFSVRSLGADTNTLTLSIRESVSTFPLPKGNVSNAGLSAAILFQEKMVAWSEENECGVTDTLNAVNTPTCADPAINELRHLLASIDAEVAATYGWDDLKIDYDFREFKGGSASDTWRWAPTDDVTAELLNRLTILNRERFETNSIVSSNTATGKSAKRGRRKKSASAAVIGGLFDEDGQ